MSAPVGDSIRRRSGSSRRPADGPRPPVRWWKLAIWSGLGLLAAFALGYAIAVFLLFPAPEASVPGIVVPRLVGQDTLYARQQLESRRLRLGTVTQLPDPAAAVGMVVAQDALAGQQLRRGALVNVAVSAGAERAVLPNVVGYAASRGAALLSALGFQVSQRNVPDLTPAGHIIGLTPAPGVAYDLPATVVLSVSTGPPPPDTTRADSLTADTAAGAAPAAVPQPGAPAPRAPAPTAPAAVPQPGAPAPRAPASTAPAAAPQPGAAPARPAPTAPRPSARDSVRHLP